MILRAIDYSQFQDTPKKWSISGLLLGDINLLVGKNATGKTRTLNIIGAIARLLSGKFKSFHTCKWDCKFDHDGKEARYQIEYDGPKIVKEVFAVGGRSFLERGVGGEGFIWAEELQRKMRFQTPEDECACVARRDKIQHPFLEPLSDWAHSFRLYHFGERFGQDRLLVLVKFGAPELDPTDEKGTTGLFKKGLDKFGDAFKTSIINDMKSIDYDLNDILISPVSLPPLNAAGEPVFLSVKEADLSDTTEQLEISAGMFRALSILVHLNYSLSAGTPSCILIDDIGEGLDFERSCSLIELLVNKTSMSSVQLLMSTNDRFVMNNVPIESWSILSRDGSQCKVYNYANSKEKFDQFKLTGLNNFDFFAMDFINEESEYEKDGNIY